MLALAASNNMARLPKPTHDVLGGCMKSGLFLMYVITSETTKKMCADKHLIYAERESHEAISLAAGERGHFGRMEVEIRLTFIDLIWGCCWLASLFFWGRGGEICQGNFSATEKTKTGNQIGEVIIKGVGGIKEVQPVTCRKEKPKSEYFESAQFKILIYSQCISMCFRRTRSPPPIFPSISHAFVV